MRYAIVTSKPDRSDAEQTPAYTVEPDTAAEVWASTKRRTRAHDTLGGIARHQRTGIVDGALCLLDDVNGVACPL